MLEIGAKTVETDEEATGGAISYIDVLDALHRTLAPKHYLEIGVRHGHSLALARVRAVGVDPAPEIRVDLLPPTHVISRASDDFFADSSNDLEADFCFIDGLHLFEQALRDFFHFEQGAAKGAVGGVDDIFPNHPAQAERVRRTRVWTGDVWRFAETILRTAEEPSEPPISVLRRDGAINPSSKQFHRLVEEIKASRDLGLSPVETVARLAKSASVPVSS